MRSLGSGEGRALAWTRLTRSRDLHQTSTTTWADRYPALFDRAAQINPLARRILSFGCSTGEELEAIRLRFPAAEIVGAEINFHARRIAAQRTANDLRISVVPAMTDSGTFDAIFALAVLQREPHRVESEGIGKLTLIYPFARFEREIRSLVDHLEAGGLLCIANAHYRIEDCNIADRLRPIAGDAPPVGQMFAPDGQVYECPPPTASIFVKR